MGLALFNQAYLASATERESVSTLDRTVWTSTLSQIDLALKASGSATCSNGASATPAHLSPFRDELAGSQILSVSESLRAIRFEVEPVVIVTYRFANSDVVVTRMETYLMNADRSRVLVTEKSQIISLYPKVRGGTVPALGIAQHMDQPFSSRVTCRYPITL